MGHKHSKDEILASALTAAVEDGLSQLTFGRLAKRLGISDRTIVYYFPSKNDLISEVIMAMGAGLQAQLGPVLADQATDHRDIVARAWPVLATPDSDRIFALFFEANGLSAVGVEPYASLVPSLVDGWIAWVAELLEGTTADRRAEAEAAIALIDGLFLVRLLSGPRAANRAAQRLGVLLR